MYGGPHAQTTLNAWGRGTFLFHAMLAQKGYLVFWLDNRGAAGRGHAWEAELLKRFGQKELEDQLKGVAWLKKQAFVDPARIGIWGWSYGGFMTLYALTHSKEFKTGVAVAGHRLALLRFHLHRALFETAQRQRAGLQGFLARQFRG